MQMVDLSHLLVSPSTRSYKNQRTKGANSAAQQTKPFSQAGLTINHTIKSRFSFTSRMTLQKRTSRYSLEMTTSLPACEVESP
jgi:hypothetical protein